MKSFNQVVFKGALGRDARISSFEKGKVASFSVATEYNFKKSDGSWGAETTWLNVTAWEGFGICPLDALKKGVKVSGTGRIRQREYTDKDNNQRTVEEILVDSLDIISEEKKPAANNGDLRQSQPQANKSYNPDTDLPF